MSGYSTFHISLMRALLINMPALGHLMLEEKRKSDYLAQVSFAIFILEIMSCNLLPFPAPKGISKWQVQESDKIQRSHCGSLLGPRKIVLITTCIECKKVE